MIKNIINTEYDNENIAALSKFMSKPIVKTLTLNSISRKIIDNNIKANNLVELNILAFIIITPSQLNIILDFPQYSNSDNNFF